MTNFSDDLRHKKLIFKWGKKYPEWFQNYSKGSNSMFSGSATGQLLRSYTVYKAINLWNTWMIGGSSGTYCNLSKSGWFDVHCFHHWFHTIILPWARRKEGPKDIVGDNLSSRFCSAGLDLCEQNSISFAWCLTVPIYPKH